MVKFLAKSLFVVFILAAGVISPPAEARDTSNTQAPRSASDRAALESAFIAAAQPWLHADPDHGDTGNESRTMARVAQLVTLNPGKEDIIRNIVEQYNACYDKAYPIFQDHLIQALAAELSDDVLARMTKFFSGPDYKRSVELGALLKPNRAQRAGLDTINAKYPNEEFNDAYRSVFTLELIRDSAVRTCDDEKRRAFQQANITDEEEE